MMAIQLSNIGSMSGEPAGRAEDHVLSKAQVNEYITGLQKRMDENILTEEQAVKAKNFLGDLDGQYRYVLKQIDSYITDYDRLISKDGSSLTENS